MDFFTEISQRWDSYYQITNKSFVCGHCSDKVASDRGFKIVNKNSTQVGGIYLCPNCHGPNFNTIENNWIPGSAFGRSVKNVPEKLYSLYDEARKCAKENCFTGAVLLCRKMLMNIAVEQGAKENLSFIKYVNYLADSGYVPPNGKLWVDHIRKKGNEATHEIISMTKDDARDLIFFTEMLLIFLYEFPSMIPLVNKPAD